MRDKIDTAQFILLCLAIISAFSISISPVMIIPTATLLAADFILTNFN